MHILIHDVKNNFFLISAGSQNIKRTITNVSRSTTSLLQGCYTQYIYVVCVCVCICLCVCHYSGVSIHFQFWWLCGCMALEQCHFHTFRLLASNVIKLLV